VSCSYDQNAIRLAGDPALDGKHPAIGRHLVIEGSGLSTPQFQTANAAGSNPRCLGEELLNETLFTSLT
jgi:hypothetical protein